GEDRAFAPYLGAYSQHRSWFESKIAGELSRHHYRPFVRPDAFASAQAREAGAGGIEAGAAAVEVAAANHRPPAMGGRFARGDERDRSIPSVLSTHQCRLRSY